MTNDESTKKDEKINELTQNNNCPGDYESNFQTEPQVDSIAKKDFKFDANSVDAEIFEENQTKSSDSNFKLTSTENFNFDNDSGEGENKNPKKQKQSKKKRRKSKIIIFLSCIIIVSILLATGMIIAVNDLLAIFKSDHEIIIEIPDKSSASDIAQLLADENIIDFPMFFRIYSKINDADNSFKPGTHKMNSKMGYGEIILALQKVAIEKDAVNITFPEGYNLIQICKLLQEKGIVSDWQEFMDAFNRQSFGIAVEDKITKSPLRFNQKEGYAFPDTYTFYLEEEYSSIAKKLLSNFAKKTDSINDKITSGMEKYNLTFDQVITLASIIQAESSDVEHMNAVAGVFHNRLNNSVSFPKLQSDPTTLYAKNIIGKYSDLSNDKMIAAYDTYTAQGLPPGPICSPGLDAILAAVSPESSEFYYFVTDKSGVFYFAATYDQHRVNCKKAGITVPY